jgi:hypothetical protein
MRYCACWQKLAGVQAQALPFYRADMHVFCSSGIQAKFSRYASGL